MELKTNSGNAIDITDEATIIPVVLQAEGVRNGSLQRFEDFSKDYRWYEGVPVIPESEHYPGCRPAGNKSNKVGQIRNVRLNSEKRRIEADAVLFNDKFNPDDLARIKSGEKFGGSIGFWADTEKTEAQTWLDGRNYTAIEKNFFGDHFAITGKPACPLGTCGFNVNRDDSMTEEVEKEPEIKANIDDKAAPVINVAPPNVNVDLTAVLTKLDAIGTEVAGLKANIASKDAEIADLKKAEEVRVNAAKDAAVAAAKAGFASLLKTNFQSDLDKLYTEYAANPAVWVITNREKIDLAEKVTIQPAGQAFVPHVNVEEDEELKSMMPSDEAAGMRKVA